MSFLRFDLDCFYCSKNVFPPNECKLKIILMLSLLFPLRYPQLLPHMQGMCRKQKASDPCNTSKEDDLDLLGDDVEAFSGSQADLEGAAEN